MRRKPCPRRLPRRDTGAALITVVIVGLVISLLGITLYTMSTYEYRQASYRDDSGSAFWLADAAIEHAKGRLFNDLTWRGAGLDSVRIREGYYKLAVKDSSYSGQPAVWMYSRGFAKRLGGKYAERDVEVFAKVVPAAFEYALFAMDTMNLSGNMGACGLVHANLLLNAGGSSLGEPGGCTLDSDSSSGFRIDPPAIRTNPPYYPKTTYYFVAGKPTAPYTEIWLMKPAAGGTYTMSDSTRANKISILAGVGVLNAATSTISYSFASDAAIDAMFDWTTGQCTRDVAAGDLYVVVNFGEFITGFAPTKAWKSDIYIKGGSVIKSSIFDTRYKAYPDTSLASLLKTTNWTGGNTQFKQASLQPANGIALVVHDVSTQGNAQMAVGTPTNGVVTYITGSIDGFNANGNYYGSTIVLGSIRQMNGNPDFWFNNGYTATLPPYLGGFWVGASGFAEILNWREVAAGPGT